ncbi:MAG: hypothetical protein C0518_11500 [Opitutus sp.]|nr:hypothetical protein [Opitutus sp.]
MSATDQLASLRQQLAARFPTTTRAAGRALATGIAAIDDATAGGLPLGAVTEIVASAPSCGVSLLWGQLLAAARAAQLRAALVDAGDEFDATSFPADLLAHLVWVRCRSVTESLAATDLLARDANFGLVLFDLRYAPVRDLRRVPSTSWYRLQRAVEPTDLALVVATPTACVPSAQLRLELDQSTQFDDLERERAVLTSQLTPQLQRQRRSLAAAS